MLRNTKRRTVRQGVSMLELVAATTIIAMTLVPAMRMMRDSLRIGREIETDTQMSTLCVNIVEEQLAKTSAKWEESPNPPEIVVAKDLSGVKYKIVRSDNPVDGGITGSLMIIEAEVWDDKNDNDQWDSGEHRVIFATKLAKVASYEYEVLGL